MPSFYGIPTRACLEQAILNRPKSLLIVEVRVCTCSTESRRTKGGHRDNVPICEAKDADRRRVEWDLENRQAPDEDQEKPPKDGPKNKWLRAGILVGLIVGALAGAVIG